MYHDQYMFSHFPVGTYTIDVRYYGKHIQGSPFKVMSSDWNQIKVLNLHSTGQVGRAVEFDSKFWFILIKT